MNFGDALEVIKLGGAVARSGWNGNGLTVRSQIPDAYSKMTMPYLYIEYPHSDKTNAGDRCPWVPSVSDIMAEDWKTIVPPLQESPLR